MSDTPTPAAAATPCPHIRPFCACPMPIQWAAATPAVLTHTEIEKLRLDVDECAALGTTITLARVPRLLATLDAAVVQRDAARQQGWDAALNAVERQADAWGPSVLDVREVVLKVWKDEALQRDALDEEAVDVRARLSQSRAAQAALSAQLAEFARQTREAQASLLAAIMDKEQERQRADAAEACLPSAHELTDDNRALHAALAVERARGERLAFALGLYFDDAMLDGAQFRAKYGRFFDAEELAGTAEDALAAPASPAAEPAE